MLEPQLFFQPLYSSTRAFGKQAVGANSRRKALGSFLKQSCSLLSCFCNGTLLRNKCLHFPRRSPHRCCLGNGSASRPRAVPRSYKQHTEMKQNPEPKRHAFLRLLLCLDWAPSAQASCSSTQHHCKLLPPPFHLSYLKQNPSRRGMAMQSYDYSTFQHEAATQRLGCSVLGISYGKEPIFCGRGEWCITWARLC